MTVGLKRQKRNRTALFVEISVQIARSRAGVPRRISPHPDLRFKVLWGGTFETAKARLEHGFSSHAPGEPQVSPR